MRKSNWNNFLLGKLKAIGKFHCSFPLSHESFCRASGENQVTLSLYLLMQKYLRNFLRSFLLLAVDVNLTNCLLSFLVLFSISKWWGVVRSMMSRFKLLWKLIVSRMFVADWLRKCNLTSHPIEHVSENFPALCRFFNEIFSTTIKTNNMWNAFPLKIHTKPLHGGRS